MGVRTAAGAFVPSDMDDPEVDLGLSLAVSRAAHTPASPMRVVFDSNVPLAALLFPEGRAAAAVENILDGSDDLVLSPPLLREVLSVLSRKFSRDREELSRVAVVLGEMGEIVDPSCRVEVFRDEPDNRIPKCAVDPTCAGKRRRVDSATFSKAVRRSVGTRESA